MDPRESQQRQFVEFKNKAESHAQALYSELEKWLTPFIGKQIVKADGETFLKKVIDKRPKVEIKGFRVLFDFTRYSIWIRYDFSDNYEGTHICDYAKGQKYLAKINDGILESVMERDEHNWPTFTPDEVIQKQRELQNMRNKISHLENEIRDFTKSS
jgi:hypothetical protein